jgi:3-oxoacyl-[acyl-carrier protein] reductase
MSSSLSHTLLVVVGSSSGVATGVIPQLAAFDRYLFISSRSGTMMANGSMHEFVVAGDNCVSGFESHFQTALSASEIRLREVVVILFSGITDSTIFVNQTPSELEKIVEVNLMSNVFATHAALKKFRMNKLRIIYVSSSRALLGDRGTVMYSTTKNALNGLARGIALEYGRFGVRANVLSLGITEVGMGTQVAEVNARTIIQRSANRSPVNLESVALAIDFLRRNDDMNGSVLMCDGGYH